MFTEVVSNSAPAKKKNNNHNPALSSGLVGHQSLQSSFCFQSEEAGISWFQLRQRQIKGEQEGTLHAMWHSWKNGRLALEDAKRCSKEAKPTKWDICLWGQEARPSLFCNRFLYKDFKTFKEIEYVTVKQKDNTEQKNHIWRSISHRLQETWTHYSAGKTLSPGP